jgi:uncharacterized membrane protein HdeD (DUF308 family)
MENTVQTVPEVNERPSSPPASPFATPDVIGRFLSRYWGAELAIGVFWVVVALVVLKFNHASVVTVGVLTGLLLLLFAAEQFVLAAIAPTARWLWAIFGVLLTVGGIVAVVDPASTFAGLADILGFIFLLIGVQWMVQAFAERPFNPYWWLTLIGGILMVVLAFWTSGQFFVERAYTLLIFVGIWALTKGVTDIVRAFQIRSLG